MVSPGNKPANSVNGAADRTFNRLQALLLEPQLSGVRQQHQVLRQQLMHLEQQLVHLRGQLADPEVLAELLGPVILILVKTGAVESREVFSTVLAELIDVALATKIKQDHAVVAAVLASVLPASMAHASQVRPEAMGHAIALTLSRALQESVKQDQGAIAQAIAPEMGAALKEQIRLEQGAIVDALYPVIGDTISRYFAELLKEINEKLEQTLSYETISRKFRARLQGVSEAELLLREATPVRVQAAFLIHKASGLVMAKAQPTNALPLESELIAGMLTAIRSFVSTYVSQSGSISELHDIEYGSAQIWLETAGYCYLAVVVQGTPSKIFFNGVKGLLTQLVRNYGDLIQSFEGDLSALPEAIPQQLQLLIESAAQTPEAGRPAAADSSGWLGSMLRWTGIGILVLLVIWAYQRHRQAWVVSDLNDQLRRDPALALYRVEVSRQHNRLILQGYVPTRGLAEQATTLIATEAPFQSVENQIVVIVPPVAEPTLAEVLVEVERTAGLLNQIDGISLTAQMQADILQIESTVSTFSQVQIIDQAFRAISGVEKIRHTTQIQ